MPNLPYHRLHRALSDHDAILARWSQTFERSSLRVPRRDTRAEIDQVVGHIVRGLAQALPTTSAAGTVIPGGLEPGTPWVRELEQAVAFAGASLAASGAPSFDITAAILALRDVVDEHLEPDEKAAARHLFEWLTLVAGDAWGTARELAAREALRDQIERDTPVVLVAPTIASVLLVGAPDSPGLESIFARLLLTVVRVGARAVIIDATGLENSEHPTTVDAIHRFMAHRKIAGKVPIVAVGLSQEAERVWRDLAAKSGASLQVVMQFLDAVTTAHDLAGYRLVQSAHEAQPS